MTAASPRQTRHNRLFDLYRQEPDTTSDDAPAPATQRPNGHNAALAALSAADIQQMQAMATNSLISAPPRRSFWRRLTD